MTFVTRFAPSPTGPLHLGHAYSALLCHGIAQALDGAFLLRMEDIDRTRSRPEWEAAIETDLRWLGAPWSGPVLRQSDRQAAYDAALDMLWARGLLYPCSCTRRDIEQALSAPQEGQVPAGPDGPVYPGTCRDRPRPAHRPRGEALRLDMARAVEEAGGGLSFVEHGHGTRTGRVAVSPGALVEGTGDVVLARRGMGTSYHLAVVVDDAHQGVTAVIRGGDLFEATGIHVLLQHLLGLPVPDYLHHRLIRDEHGKRLAKRDDARSISRYREDGRSPGEVRALTGLTDAEILRAVRSLAGESPPPAHPSPR